jgi:hypothetical protein
MVFSHLLLVGFPSRVGLEAEEGPSAPRVAKTLPDGNELAGAQARRE